MVRFYFFFLYEARMLLKKSVHLFINFWSLEFSNGSLFINYVVLYILNI